MSNFVMLWAKTLDSSIWQMESKETRILWFTILMMKDKDGVVLSSKIGLARRARLEPEECEESLRVLLSPDKNDTSGVDSGRRLREVPGGWQIVNHDAYRFSSEAKRALWAEQKARQRAKEALQIDKPKKKAKKCPPLPGQGEYERALKAGASDEELGKIVERNLPAPVASNPVTNGDVYDERSLQGKTKWEQPVAEHEPALCVNCGECVPESGTICNECRETRLSD